MYKHTSRGLRSYMSRAHNDTSKNTYDHHLPAQGEIGRKFTQLALIVGNGVAPDATGSRHGANDGATHVSHGMTDRRTEVLWRGVAGAAGNEWRE